MAYKPRPASGESAFDKVRKLARDLFAEIDKGHVKPAYLLAGADDYQRELILRRLVARLVPAEFRDTSLTTFDGRDADARRVSQELEATGFRFDDAPRRVVLVRDAPYFVAGAKDDAALLVKRLKAGLMSDVAVVFEVRGALGAKTELVKAIEEVGLVLEFPTLSSEDDVEKLLRTKLGRAEKILTRSAIAALVERCGLDAQRLNNEVEKLIAYVDQREEISVDDVRKMVAPTAELNAFDLVDAVAERKPRQALEQLRALFAQQAEPFQIMGMLTRHVRLLLQARHLIDAGLVDARLLRQRPYDFSKVLYDKSRGESLLDGWKRQCAEVLPADGRQSLLGQHYFPLFKSLQLAQHFPQRVLEAALERLLQCDLALKSSHLPPEQEIELLVADFCTRIDAGATIELDLLLEA